MIVDGREHFKSCYKRNINDLGVETPIFGSKSLILTTKHAPRIKAFSRKRPCFGTFSHRIRKNACTFSRFLAKYLFSRHTFWCKSQLFDSLFWSPTRKTCRIMISFLNGGRLSASLITTYCPCGTIPKFLEKRLFRPGTFFHGACFGASSQLFDPKK